MPDFGNPATSTAFPQCSRGRPVSASRACRQTSFERVGSIPGPADVVRAAGGVRLCRSRQDADDLRCLESRVAQARRSLHVPSRNLGVSTGGQARPPIWSGKPSSRNVPQTRISFSSWMSSFVSMACPGTRSGSSPPRIPLKPCVRSGWAASTAPCCRSAPAVPWYNKR